MIKILILSIGVPVAVLLLAFLIFLLIVRNKNPKVSLENITGLTCAVVERIDNFAGSGIVKVKGQMWAARSVDDEDVFEPGEKLSVVAIEGVRLVCKRK